MQDFDSPLTSHRSDAGSKHCQQPQTLAIGGAPESRCLLGPHRQTCAPFVRLRPSRSEPSSPRVSARAQDAPYRGPKPCSTPCSPRTLRLTPRVQGSSKGPEPCSMLQTPRMTPRMTPRAQGRPCKGSGPGGTLGSPRIPRGPQPVSQSAEEALAAEVSRAQPQEIWVEVMTFRPVRAPACGHVQPLVAGYLDLLHKLCEFVLAQSMRACCLRSAAGPSNIPPHHPLCLLHAPTEAPIWCGRCHMPHVPLRHTHHRQVRVCVINIVCWAGQGDVFGELAALAGQLREATVVTTLASELLVLSRWAVFTGEGPAPAPRGAAWGQVK